MSLSPIIDVAIGLILVYLLMGLFATAVQETVAGFLTLRGKLLRDALAKLLGGGDKNALFQQIYGHALVAGSAASPCPSYVPARNFVLALMQALSPDAAKPAPLIEIEAKVAALPEGGLKQCLQAFLANADGDLDTFKKSLATWFDDAMDRLSGLYKRYSHAIAFGIGLFLAVALNVDSLRIAETLWVDQPLRAQIVAAADAYAKDHPNGPGSADASPFFALDLPIGWAGTASATYATNTRTLGPKPLSWNDLSNRETLLAALLGWLLTGFAASLGAPFWFDTLQRFLKLRTAGAKPKRANA